MRCLHMSVVLEDEEVGNSGRKCRAHGWVSEMSVHV